MYYYKNKLHVAGHGTSFTHCAIISSATHILNTSSSFSSKVLVSTGANLTKGSKCTSGLSTISSCAERGERAVMYIYSYRSLRGHIQGYEENTGSVLYPVTKAHCRKDLPLSFLRPQHSCSYLFCRHDDGFEREPQ